MPSLSLLVWTGGKRLGAGSSAKLSLLGAYPADAGDVDDLFIRTDAFDFIIGLPLFGILRAHFDSFSDRRCPAQRLDLSHGAINIFDLETNMIDAQP